MIELTIIFSTYGQPLMLEKQVEVLASYPDELKNRLAIIIADDCGTPPVGLEDVEPLLSGFRRVEVFRVEKDIPWNQPGARNLAMHHASGWCLMLDCDMTFSVEMMNRALDAIAGRRRGEVIKWVLRHVDSGEVDTSSPNTWLIHRDDFFAVGGYAEHYAGNKGWSDCTLQDCLKATFKIHHRTDIWAHFHSTKTAPDAMVTTLDRSTAANKKKRIRDTRNARAMRGWRQWARARRDVPRLGFKWSKELEWPKT